MAGGRGGLAASVGARAGPVAPVTKSTVLLVNVTPPGKLPCMDLLHELARTDIDPALLAQVQALFAQQQAKLAELNAWSLATLRAVAAGSGTAKAVDHAFKRWSALERYVNSGTLPIDNNPVENAIRPIAIGKKNWLLTGSERAGRRAAAIQSLFATAKLNGLDSALWLANVLERLPPCPNSQID